MQLVSKEASPDPMHRGVFWPRRYTWTVASVRPVAHQPGSISGLEYSIDVPPCVDPGWRSRVRVCEEEKVQSLLQAKVEMELLYGCTRRPAQHSDERFEYGWQREGICGRLADSMCCAVVAVYLETGSRRGELTVSIWSSSPQLPRTLSMIALAKPGEASGLPLRLSGLRPTAPWIRGGVRPMPNPNTLRWPEYATPSTSTGRRRDA